MYEYSFYMLTTVEPNSAPKVILLYLHVMMWTVESLLLKSYANQVVGKSLNQIKNVLTHPNYRMLLTIRGDCYLPGCILQC